VEEARERLDLPTTVKVPEAFKEEVAVIVPPVMDPEKSEVI
jgi:hypothetical protein